MNYDTVSNLNIEYHLLNKIISPYHIFAIPNIFIDKHECDLLVLNKALYTTEYEIKKTEADYYNDFKKKNKHSNIKGGGRTNKFYFVIPESLNVAIPSYSGLIKYEIRPKFIYFKTIKPAPFLTKKKATPKMIEYFLLKLNWKFYKHAVIPKIYK